ncbi:MAG: lysophospholipid acyltransferase family protein [Symbiopectobacterium sp.]|uniref:lysophospholipid acyltransferase family protein n=1 Tax=Symbiopectobacterium sp. TaxID=2952789 RepID=UPI0039E7DDF8
MLLLGVGYGVLLFPYAPLLGWGAALLALATAYIRLLGGTCGLVQRFSGPMAKQHRMALRRYLSARIFGAVLIERKRKSGTPFSSEDLLAPLVTVQEKQESLIFFPEGTRGNGDDLGEFKSGLFHLMQRYPNARLVPVWLENLNRVLPKGSRLVVPIICSATFGEAISGPEQDETKIDFLNRAKQALEALSHA